MEQSTLKTEKTPTRREQHRFLSRHPILGFILLTLWCWLFVQLGGVVVGMIGGAAMIMGYAAYWLMPVGGLVSAGMAFLALLIHKCWFRPEFSGCLTRRYFGLGLAFVAADIVYAVVGLFTEPCSMAGLTLNNLTMALAAGVTEEVIFRAVPGSYLMRQWREEKKIPVVMLLTAAVFGLIHATNLAYGADLGATVVQILGAFGIGVLYAAAFLRTGNIWPCMLIHFLHDVLAFLATEAIQNGIQVTALATVDVVVSLIFTVIFVVLGFWLVRPAKRAGILRLWDEKWSRAEARAIPEPAETA